MIKDKISLVTGSAKALGRAMALDLARQGSTVIVHYRTSERGAKETLEEVKKHSPDSVLVKGDLTKEEDVDRIFTEIFEKFGKVDILINTVGNFIFKNISEVTNEELRDVIESNLYPGFYCMQKVLPKMREQGYGRIINFGCESAHVLVREKTTPYYIAKAGVIALTKIFAESEAKNGITVNAISPGVLESGVGKENIEMPSGRYGRFDDIINVVSFLLSENSSYVNGANIEVSGGWVPWK